MTQPVALVVQCRCLNSCLIDISDQFGNEVKFDEYAFSCNKCGADLHDELKRAKTRLYNARNAYYKLSKKIHPKDMSSLDDLWSAFLEATIRK